VDGQPFVIQRCAAGMDRLYLHASAASRMLRELETAIPTCVTVTLVDGLVSSRSAFDHSMNYRSVVAFRRARKIADLEQKVNSLRVISELKATTVLEFPIEEASSKVRSRLSLDEGL